MGRWGFSCSPEQDDNCTKGPPSIAGEERSAGHATRYRGLAQSPRLRYILKPALKHSRQGLPDDIPATGLDNRRWLRLPR